MSADFGKAGRSRSRSPTDNYGKKSLLAKVNKSELKHLRVAIRRSDVIGGGPQSPMERSIDDPAKICAYVHFRKDEHKIPKLPIFGKGIKVNQDFTENRRVFTHHKNSKSSRKSISRSRSRSRSPRNRKKNKTPDRGRTGRSRRSRSNQKSKSRSRSTSRRKRSGRRSSSRSSSGHRSRSKERRYSLESRKYKADHRHYSSQKSRRSHSRSRSLSYERNPNCPVHGDREHHKKSLTPLRPGEYRPGHPDLAFRNRRPISRSRSRSYDNRSRFKRSRSRDVENVPSTSRERTSSERHIGSSRTSRRYESPVKNDRKERRSKSRSSIKSDRHRRHSRSPYKTHSPVKRPYNVDRSRSPRRRSRSPHYGGPRGENMHGEYGYYEGWGPGPRVPTGRGAFPMQPYYPPAFHPRGMMPGALIPPGLMLVPRPPIMPHYRPFRPHYPVYNSGAVAQKETNPNTKPATVTSEKNQVVITEVNSQGSESNDENVQQKSLNENDKNGKQDSADRETKEKS